MTRRYEYSFLIFGVNFYFIVTIVNYFYATLY